MSNDEYTEQWSPGNIYMAQEAKRILLTLPPRLFERTLNEVNEEYGFMLGDLAFETQHGFYERERPFRPNNPNEKTILHLVQEPDSPYDPREDDLTS